MFLKLLRAFTRRKPIEKGETETELHRCLGPIDLTALGVGSTLGVGVYVIIGTVAANQAGPSVVLSFLIAAVSSIFAGLCYAEFGAVVPKAGSAYIYSYISVGELMAYIIGWNLILEYVIGTASVARSYSNYVDSLFDNKIQDFFMQYMRLPETDWFSSYPDIFAFAITMLLSLIVLIGVQESTRFTTIFTGVNIMVILYCVIVGLFRIDFHNWSIEPEEIPVNQTGGDGGFFPYGIKGMVSGAATCFYSYVGFDAIATTGEEVINPQRDIPLGIVLSLLIISVAYCAVSAVQTLIWPYYGQNQKAPLPYVFDKVGLPMARYVITIGALAGLSTSLLGGMFPLPRILYAMASDGLVFKFLAKINARFKTPFVATLISGLFTALMAMFFDIDQLAEMMSIGTLLAYSLVAISVLILRYKKEKYTEEGSSKDDLIIPRLEQAFDEKLFSEKITTKTSFPNVLFNLSSNQEPNQFTSKLSIILIVFECILIVVINAILYFYEAELYSASLPTGVIIGISICALILIIGYICLARQPMVSMVDISFKVPFVPFLPLLSVFINIYLMVHLNPMTWIRFLIWMVVGFLIYFSYGIVQSVGYMTAEQKAAKL